MDEVQESAIVEANLTDAGDDATAEEILQATTGYSDAAVQIALRRLGGGGGGSGFLTAEVALTDAQIKALGTEGPGAVEIVEAPGAGEWIHFVRGIITIDAATNAYGNLNASVSLYLAWDPTGTLASMGLDQSGLTGLFGGDTEEALAVLLPTVAIDAGNLPVPAYQDRSQVENLPLVLVAFNNGAGAFTGGNAANSGTVKVWYTIESFA